MKSNRSVAPESLERLLAERAEGGDEVDAETLSSEALDPRHLLAVATTTESGLNSLAADIDWDSFLASFEQLDREREMRLLVRLVRHLGTRTAGGIDTAEGIEAIGDRVYELRHEEPHVFIAFLHELHGLLRRDSSSEAVSAAEEQFRKVSVESDRVSSERIQAFREQDIRNRLVDPTIGTEARLSLLEMLGEESVEEVPVEVTIDVLYPLRNHYDAAVERAVLETVGSWAEELPTRTDSDEAVDSLEAFLAGEREELPPLLVTELVIVGYVGPAIVDWVLDLTRPEERQDVLTAAFRALECIGGLREYGADLAEFIAEVPLEPEAMHAGIDLLESILVGLAPYQHDENPVQDDHFRRVFFTDQELSVDETVRETLQAVADDEAYPDEVRAHAARSWLSVRPPEIHDALWEIDPDDIGEDPVVAAKLEAAANHRLIEFVDVVDDLWASGPEEPERLEPLVETLDELETQEITDILLDPAFDHDDPALRDAAREALVDSGYEAQVDRERQRRTVLDRIATRYDTMTTATDTDRDIRDRTGDRMTTEGKRKRTRLRSSRAASRSVDTLVDFRAKGATGMLQLAPLFDKLEELADRIEDVVRAIERLESQLQEELEEAKRIERDIKQVERDIDDAENDLDNARNRKSELDSRISELEHDIIPELESDARKVNREIENVEKQAPFTKPQKPQVESDNRIQEYERQLEKWRQKQRKLDSLQSERQSIEQKIGNAEDELQSCQSELRQVKTDIEDLKRKLSELRSRHGQLSEELDASMGRIDEYEHQLRELSDRLDQLRNEYEGYAQQVEEIESRLRSIRKRSTSNHSRLVETNEQARSEAAQLRSRLSSLSSEQSDARDRRQDLVERIEQLTEQLAVDHDDFEALGERTEVETPEADTDAYEVAADTADRQYERNVAAWRLDSILRRSVEGETLSRAAPEVEQRASSRATEEDRT